MEIFDILISVFNFFFFFLSYLCCVLLHVAGSLIIGVQSQVHGVTLCIISLFLVCPVLPGVFFFFIFE